MISMNSYCFQCLVTRTLDKVRPLGDDETVTAFARDLMQMMLDGPADMASPFYAPRIAQLFHDHFGLPLDRDREEKELSRHRSP